jgi:hypothetical protein
LKERATYDRMIAHQLNDLKGAGPGTKSYPPLRARTASLSPSEMMTASTSTRSILPWCAPASASATGRPGARQQRGAPGPGAVLTTSASSASCARPVCRSSTRSRAGSRFGEFVSFAELQAITDLTLKQITSLFGRYSSALSGRVPRRRCKQTLRTSASSCATFFPRSTATWPTAPLAATTGCQPRSLAPAISGPSCPSFPACSALSLPRAG